MEYKLDIYTPLIRSALSRAKQNDVYAIIRLQDAKYFEINHIDGSPEGKIIFRANGMGITVFTGEGAAGFASTGTLENDSINRAVDLASKLAKDSAKYENTRLNKEIFHLDTLNERLIRETAYSIDSKPSDEIEDIVRDINMRTNGLDDRLSVHTSYLCIEDEWRIARTDGTDVAYSMPRSRIDSTMTLKEGGNISDARFNVQGTDYGVILDDDKQELYDKRAKITKDLVSGLLNAGTLKGGHYKAVLSYPFAGLYIHEAVGHAFETDALKNSIVGDEGSLMKGKKVAPGNISFIDGPVDGLWGCQLISPNGVKRKTVEFIRNGVIEDALSDVFSAREAGVELNGCGRAQDYTMLPIPRMSATRMVDNDPYRLNKASLEDMTLDDIYEFLVENGELKKGDTIVYPVVGTGGQVNSTDGTFMFNCAGIYAIRHPKEIKLYKQAAFSGNTLGTIGTRAKGVGKICTDHPGVCGKEGQKVPVSIGGNLFFILDRTQHVTFGGEQ